MTDKSKPTTAGMPDVIYALINTDNKATPFADLYNRKVTGSLKFAHANLIPEAPTRYQGTISHR